MKRSLPVRTDGTFGKLYQAQGDDIRKVIAAYKAKKRLDYRQAWEAWFKWAGKRRGK